MDSTNHKIMELEADFYQNISRFESVFKNYSDLIVQVPMDNDNLENVKQISEGLQNLTHALDSIAKTYSTLCEIKGVLSQS